ncbi:hypothetical protein [Escherichia phage vB_EcoM_EP57]|nr:hypothetical protein [Escherichia phage vB_EcoM_EP57]
MSRAPVSPRHTIRIKSKRLFLSLHFFTNLF